MCIFAADLKHCIRVTASVCVSVHFKHTEGASHPQDCAVLPVARIGVARSHRFQCVEVIQIVREAPVADEFAPAQATLQLMLG